MDIVKPGRVVYHFYGSVPDCRSGRFLCSKLFKVFKFYHVETPTS